MVWIILVSQIKSNGMKARISIHTTFKVVSMGLEVTWKGTSHFSLVSEHFM